MTTAIKRTRVETKLARKAIAEFVDSNIPRFSGWLNQIANGIPQCNTEGVVQLNANGTPIWLVKPDPATAMKLVADIAEYHLPRLSRSDVAMVAQVENVHTLEVSQMTSQQLQERVAMFLGMTEPNTIEGESVEIPDWLESK